MQDVYAQIATRIIDEQRQIIGPIAIEQANSVSGLSYDANSHISTLEGDRAKIIDDLIAQFRNFFGQAAVEVCKDAASNLLPQLPSEQVPSSLK